MAKKVNWTKMEQDLEVKLGEVRKEISSTGLAIMLKLRGRKEGKQNKIGIIAQLPYPEELAKSRNDFSADGELRYRSALREFQKTSQSLNEIMKKHGLTPHAIRNPIFISEDGTGLFSTAYNLDNNDYR